MEKNENENILKKIKKLWDKANSCEKIGSLEEAEVFFNKVNELLLQYNLSTIDLNNVKDDQTFIREEQFDSGYKSINWKFDFISKIAELNFCKTLWNYNYSKYRLIGSKTNIEITNEFLNLIVPVVQILYDKEYLEKVITLREKWHVIASSYEEAIEKFYKGEWEGETDPPGEYRRRFYVVKEQIMPSSYADKMKNEKQKYYIKDLACFFNLYKNKFVDSYTLGFADGLSHKIRNERKKNQPDIKESTTALVVFMEKKIEEYCKTNHPRIKSVSRDIRQDSGYTSGYEKGNNFDLSKKVNSGKIGLLN